MKAITFDLLVDALVAGFGLWTIYSASQSVLPPSYRLQWLREDMPQAEREKFECTFIKLWGGVAIMLGVLKAAMDLDNFFAKQ